MGLTRVPNWEAILYDRIEAAKTMPFKYGTHDCTAWSASVLRDYTDLDWFPSWKNKREAILQQKKKPMEEQVTEVLGPPNSNILNTQRGDLVQKGTGMAASLGICVGSKVVFLKEEEGICYIDLKDCTYSWRV